MQSHWKNQPRIEKTSKQSNIGFSAPVGSQTNLELTKPVIN